MICSFIADTFSIRYYTLSIILGTVALSYGSVPMYKMVRYPRSYLTLTTS